MTEKQKRILQGILDRHWNYENNRKNLGARPTKQNAVECKCEDCAAIRKVLRRS